MEENNEYKIADFAKYCKLCKHWEEPETSDVCNMCLSEPGTPDRRPYNYISAEEEVDNHSADKNYEVDNDGKVTVYKKVVRRATKNLKKVTEVVKEVIT